MRQVTVVYESRTTFGLLSTEDEIDPITVEVIGYKDKTITDRTLLMSVAYSYGSEASGEYSFTTEPDYTADMRPRRPRSQMVGFGRVGLPLGPVPQAVHGAGIGRETYRTHGSYASYCAQHAQRFGPASRRVRNRWWAEEGRAQRPAPHEPVSFFGDAAWWLSGGSAGSLRRLLYLGIAREALRLLGSRASRPHPQSCITQEI